MQTDSQTESQKDREKECPLIDGTVSSKSDRPGILKYRPACPVAVSEHVGGVCWSVDCDSVVA